MARASKTTQASSDPAALATTVNALLAVLDEINVIVRRKAISGESTIELRSRRAEIERRVSEVRAAAVIAADSRECTTGEEIAELAKTFATAGERVVADRLMLLEIPEMSR
jgi:hypothetical protein